MTTRPILLLIAILVSGCDALSGPVEGSGRVAARAVPVEGTFTGIEIEGAFRVGVMEAPQVSVSAEADDNLLPLLEAVVDGGRLRLSASRSWTSTNPFVLRLAAPVLSSVVAAGSADLRVASLAGDAVGITASGASRVAVGAVRGKTVRVAAGGTATVDLEGAAPAERVEIRASDTAAVEADLDCADLSVNGEGGSKVSGPRTRTATLSLSASAVVDLVASERLTVNAVNSASVRYGGKPEVTGRAGAGVTIERRED